MRQGAAVNVFQLASHRHAVGDAADLDAPLPHQLRQKMCGRLALHRGICRQYDFTDLPGRQQRRKLRTTELLLADDIQRRNVAHQNEIASAIATRLFDGHHVSR